jgi:hypothetical protein
MEWYQYLSMTGVLAVSVLGLVILLRVAFTKNPYKIVKKRLDSFILSLVAARDCAAAGNAATLSRHLLRAAGRLGWASDLVFERVTGEDYELEPLLTALDAAKKQLAALRRATDPAEIGAGLDALLTHTKQLFLYLPL